MTTQTSFGWADLGAIGLAVMGRNLVLSAEGRLLAVCVCNRSAILHATLSPSVPASDWVRPRWPNLCPALYGQAR
jgi:hypothetical protein